MADKLTFIEAVAHRRSIYKLTNSLPISDARAQEIVTDAVKHTPSAFDSRTTRIVALLNEDHEKFWEFTTELLRVHVGDEEKFKPTKARMDGFKAAKLTVLFFEDTIKIGKMAEQVPRYADKFGDWSEHTSAMHQYVLWTAFEAEGAGCNLQHYNPVPDIKTKEHWKLPQEWVLKAQLVVGGLGEDARKDLKQKDFSDIEERLHVFGAK